MSSAATMYMLLTSRCTFFWFFFHLVLLESTDLLLMKFTADVRWKSDSHTGEFKELFRRDVFSYKGIKTFHKLRPSPCIALRQLPIKSVQVKLLNNRTKNIVPTRFEILLAKTSSCSQATFSKLFSRDISDCVLSQCVGAVNANKTTFLFIEYQRVFLK